MAISSIKSKLKRLEQSLLPDIDVTKLSDDELNKLEDELDESLAKKFGWQKVNELKDWLAALSDDELGILENDSAKLRMEVERLGL